MANSKMELLTKEALRVYDGMIAISPLSEKEETLSLSSELVPKFNGCYALNNSTVCFVHDNDVYVIPYTRVAIEALHSAGFCERYFYVPFSNYGFPKLEKSKWEALKEGAKKINEADFVSDCQAYCDELHIGSISNEILKNCFEMPEIGVRVKHLYFEDVYYPVMNYRFFDYHCNNLGKYSYNNGLVLFVYRNGKTYVTKGYKIIKELRAAGYTESDIFVPFSNGEKILDPALKARWESIVK